MMFVAILLKLSKRGKQMNRPCPDVYLFQSRDEAAAFVFDRRSYGTWDIWYRNVHSETA